MGVVNVGAKQLREYGKCFLILEYVDGFAWFLFLYQSGLGKEEVIGRRRRLGQGAFINKKAS